MVVHIVMWRLLDSALGSGRAANARLVQEKLEALRGRIPGLRRLEVGSDFSASPASADVVLVCEFDSREALAAYQAHPEHRAVVAFVTQVVAERRVADYETGR